ncbi:MAG: hypothetical protein K0B85_06760 [Coriobacteriia bacterium]|nr:hypothetical protein [Coriobacteriia bacterium]
MTLARQLIWEYRRPANDAFEPFSVAGLDNGNVLVASRTNEVLEISPSKRVVWSYTRLTDNPQLVNVYAAERLPNGNTLITDRRADFVIEVTPDKQVVWRYGVNTNSLAPGSLIDPFSATRLPNGNTLITDNRGGNRVIEVRTSDYDPAAPNLGYTAESIVWQYGQAGVQGTSPGLLASPRHAQRLSGGNTLITDSGDQTGTGNRIIEVTSAGQIVWQHGITGETGVDDLRLDRPSSAVRLPNGNTVIVEEDGERMLEVNRAGEVVDWYGGGEPVPEDGAVSKLRSVYRTSSGTTLIADQGNERVIEVGYALTGTVVSHSLSLGLPGVEKTVSAMQVVYDARPGTTVRLEYALDGGEWIDAGGPSAEFESVTATTVRYRLTLESASAAYTPVVRGVYVRYDVAPDDPGPVDPGGPDGGDPGGGDPDSEDPDEEEPDDGELGDDDTDKGTDEGTDGLSQDGGSRPSGPGGSARRPAGPGSGSTTGGTTPGGLQSGEAEEMTRKIAPVLETDVQSLDDTDGLPFGFVRGTLLEATVGGAADRLGSGALSTPLSGRLTGLILLLGAYTFGFITPSGQMFVARLIGSRMLGMRY